jgi:hypothetical protein
VAGQLFTRFSPLCELGSRQIGGVKHLQLLDIPTPRSDRIDDAFTCAVPTFRYANGIHVSSRFVMSLPLKALMTVLIAAFAFAIASPANAEKTRKHKKVVTASSSVQGKYWGTNLFPAGPLYFSGVYLGDDPDPNIRFQIWRDISGRFGGEP